MFKVAFKLTILTLVMTGLSLFISGDKAYAGSCPGAPNAYPNWGVSDGGAHLGAMGGLLVYAQNTQNGQPLNDITYTLKSDLPGVSGTSSGHDIDEKIFEYPPGQNGRSKSQPFTTNAPIKTGSGSPYRCDGWSVLGPGITKSDGSVQAGNGWVVDCYDVVNGGQVYVDYWIPQVSKPNGQNGHWKMKIFGVSQIDSSQEYNLGKKFYVNNGQNVTVHLLWYPQPDQPTEPTEGLCTFLTVANNAHADHRKRVFVEITGISLGRQRNNNQPSTDTVYPSYPGDGGRPRSVAAWVGGDSSGLEPGASPQSKQWFYIPWDGHSIKVKVTEGLFYDDDDPGTAKSWHDNTNYLTQGGGWSSTEQSVTCYSATCEITDATGTGPGGIVKAGETITVQATITNTSRDNLKLWTPALEGDGGTHSANTILEANASYPITFGVQASGNITAQRIVVHPVYWGRLGGDCDRWVDVYKEFNLVPTAGPVALRNGGEPDQEDPEEAVFTSNVDNIAWNRADVSVPVTRTLTKNGSNYPPSPWMDSPTMGDVSFTHTAPISNSALGDEYCGRISLSPAWGWQGPSNRVIIEHERSDGGPDNCDRVVNRPYLRAYGADVVAGSGQLGDDCNPGPTNNIRGYLSSRSNKSGTGVQLAAIAMGMIEDFSTASLRTSAPQAKDGLSFGNDPSPIGGYGGDTVCFDDYFNETQSDNEDKRNTVGSSLLSPNSHSDYEQTLVTNGTDNNHQLTLSGANNFDRKKIIYVDGDVRINGNITYANFSDPTNAPSFTVVARGNIYINHNVKQLDGLYIAQQKPDGSGGVIYTCSNGFTPYQPDTNALYANCGGQEGEDGVLANYKRLIVNGAFIAHDVKFYRVHKSLRDSKSHTNETADRNPSSNNSQASEIFNYSPEIYLSPPPFARDSDSSTRFQYYTTLPPIL